MVEASLFSGWLTPTSLFVLLNIVIATILLSSTFTRHHNPCRHRPETTGEPPQLARAPSLFSRVTSFTFTNYRYPPCPTHGPDDPARPDPEPAAPISRVPSLLSRVSSLSFSGLYRAEQPEPEPPLVVNQGEKSEGKMENEEAREFDVGKKKKRAALKRETASFRSDEEVDAKADEFINKFKQQLKLQRLESLLRYRSSAN